ncbi:MAG: heme o synthase [Fimbriiglobus sp.]
MKTLEAPRRGRALNSEMPMPETPPSSPPSATPSRGKDFVELAKPRIATMALVTVAAGYLLGAAESFDALQLLHTLIGAGMVAAGGSALNHLLEVRADAKMNRTARRPLPTGRVHRYEALIYGLGLAIAGTVYLYLLIPHVSAAIAAAATAFLYVAVYTPMKRWTSWNTIVGAIPGALPPIIGWCAARGEITWEAVSLFAILFVWQLPHFYSIAFMHREDYARGGMKMLPVVEREDGFYTGLATVGTCGLLVAVTVMPFAVEAARWLYLAGSLPLAVWFFLRCLRFARTRTHVNAKSVLRGSLVYLVGIMFLLVIDGIAPRYL